MKDLCIAITFFLSKNSTYLITAFFPRCICKWRLSQALIKGLHFHRWIHSHKVDHSLTFIGFFRKGWSCHQRCKWKFSNSICSNFSCTYIVRKTQYRYFGLFWQYFSSYCRKRVHDLIHSMEQLTLEENPVGTLCPHKYRAIHMYENVRELRRIRKIFGWTIAREKFFLLAPRFLRT